MNGSDTKTLEAHRLILRDGSGRVRLELTAESQRVEPRVDGNDEPNVMQGPELVLFDTAGRRRLSLSVCDRDQPPHDTYMTQVAVYGSGEQKILQILGFDKNGHMYFTDKTGKSCLTLGFDQYDDESRPELVLSSGDGWRLLLVVAENQPHVVLYDAHDDPRLHLTVNRRGTPHVRRHFWRSLIPRWRWYGYYPRDGAGDS